MIATFYTDGISQITASIQNTCQNVFYKTIDLKHSKHSIQEIQKQISDLMPPSIQRVLCNEINFFDTHKSNRFKIMHLIRQCVNQANARASLSNQKQIDLIEVPLNKSVDFTVAHIENIDQKSRYFLNQCLYYYDQFKKPA